MEMITVKTFDNYFTANIILTRLKHSGVECYLKDEYTVTIDPILSNAIGGIKLVVPVNDSAAVIEMLKQFDAEYLQSAECPKCTANDILHVPKKTSGNYFTAILTWLFSSYAIAPDYVYQCQQCGYESKTFPENIAVYN